MDNNSFDTKSMYDPDQITRMGFDDNMRAHRMYIVNPMEQINNMGNLPVMPHFASNNIVETKIERVEIPVPIKEIEIREIKVPEIIKEVQIVYVDRIIVQKELQIERVEIPIIVKEMQEIIKEVPIIQKEIQVVNQPVVVTEYKYLSNFVKVCLAAQTLALILMLLIRK